MWYGTTVLSPINNYCGLHWLLCAVCAWSTRQQYKTHKQQSPPSITINVACWFMACFTNMAAQWHAFLFYIHEILLKYKSRPGNRLSWSRYFMISLTSSKFRYNTSTSGHIPKQEVEANKMENARSQASAAVELNSPVFWVITRRKVVWNRRFGNTHRSHFQGSSSSSWTAWLLKMEPIGNPETSVSSHLTARNNPGDRRIKGGALWQWWWWWWWWRRR